MDIERVSAELARRGMSIRAAARALHYDHALLSRVLSGKQAPSTALADALTSLVGSDEDQQPVASSDYAQSIRETSQRLIALDNEMNGLPIAEAAARSFKAVHRRLGSGDYKATHERD